MEDSLVDGESVIPALNLEEESTSPSSKSPPGEAPPQGSSSSPPPEGKGEMKGGESAENEDLECEGIPNNMLSLFHVLPYVPEEATPASDEACILISTIVHD
ncbi:uncharacterized protein LOC126410098 [Nymphaea colorata]|uniref:uncharacterized protein LOC126410098 n=1 Tax=Nymphaea colorata TaxID=210225 RepID=UPI00214EC5AA|nr:uncharacterized protein LOC126410098 [Nymphaea colorata]